MKPPPDRSVDETSAAVPSLSQDDLHAPGLSIGSLELEERFLPGFGKAHPLDDFPVVIHVLAVDSQDDAALLDIQFRCGRVLDHRDHDGEVVQFPARPDLVDPDLDAEETILVRLGCDELPDVISAVGTAKIE